MASLSTPPVQRLVHLIQQEKQDLYILLVYVIFSGLLTLTIPVTTQVLVQIIAAGIFIQPLIVLSFALLLGLLIGGGIRVLEFFLVEVIQQRIFAGIALKLAEKIPLIQYQALLNRYAPELMNRFFDVVIVQKTLAKILLETPSSILQIIVGLLVMAFYSPVLLAFDVLFLTVFGVLCFLLGKGGIRTSIQESVEKYHIAGFLEDLARCHVSLKLDGDRQFLFQKADKIVLEYLVARKAHFKIVLRQTIVSYIFQALAATGILAIGGWLVINRQLTLGQLVASEVIIVLVLSAMEKLVNSFPSYFDLLASLDKVGYITDLPVDERINNTEVMDSRLKDNKGLYVECKNLSYTYPNGPTVIQDLNFEVPPGAKVSLIGPSGEGKSTLGLIICGVLKPDKGLVYLNGIDCTQLSVSQIHSLTSFVSDQNDVIEGTLLENVTLGRPEVTLKEAQWALEVACLTEEITKMPGGLSTPVYSSGVNLSRGQIQRLMIARAIADKPRLLILDECFTGIDDATRTQVLNNLLGPDMPWTLLDISHDPNMVLQTDYAYVMNQGKIVAEGQPLELLTREEKAFVDLFPSLVKTY